MKTVITLFALSLSALTALGQGTPYPPDHPAYDILDAIQIRKGGFDSLHLVHRPVSREDAAHFALALDSSGESHPGLTYLLIDNSECLPLQRAQEMNQDPYLKYFYGKKGHTLGFDRPNFRLRFNHIIYEKAGVDRANGEVLFHDVKGIDFRGSLDNKVGYYFNLQVHGARFANYVRIKGQNGHEHMPYTSLVKTETEGFYFSFYGPGSPVNTYLMSQGGISFQASKSIRMELGHGQQFIGRGMRSLILSDYANNHLFLKVNTKIWKFDYQNVFKELTTYSSNRFPGDNLNPKKYVANHHLSMNLGKRLNVGVFETVIFARENGFELNYLNPLILYRTVEHNLGSPDNSMLGVDAALMLPFKAQVYTQFILDEFKAEELFNQTGWWANKYALQLGLKAVDIGGLEGLNAQIEGNLIRPFIYGYRDSFNINNYTHFSQAMAHPMGANLNEILVSAQYGFKERWNVDARFMHTVYGADTAGSHWGNNIFLNNNDREQDYNNTIGQGVETKVTLARMRLSYELWTNCKLNFDVLIRNQGNEISSEVLKTRYIGLGAQVNFWERPLDF